MVLGGARAYYPEADRNAKSRNQGRGWTTRRTARATPGARTSAPRHRRRARIRTSRTHTEQFKRHPVQFGQGPLLNLQTNAGAVCRWPLPIAARRRPMRSMCLYPPRKAAERTPNGSKRRVSLECLSVIKTQNRGRGGRASILNTGATRSVLLMEGE